MFEDDSIILEFAQEAREHLDNIEEELVLLLQNTGNPEKEQLNNIFRAFHSIKGGAGFLYLTHIGTLSHALENVLSLMRSGRMTPEKEIVDALLAGVDVLNSLLANVKSSNEMVIDEIMAQLESIQAAPEPPSRGSTCDENIELLTASDDSTGFAVSTFALENLLVEYNHMYVLQYDMEELSRSKATTPLTLIRRLTGAGEIVDARMEAGADDLSSLPVQHPLRYDVLYATVLDPDELGAFTGFPPHSVTYYSKESFHEQVRNASSQAVPGQDFSDRFKEKDELFFFEDGFGEGEEREATEAEDYDDDLSDFFSPDITAQFIQEAEELLEQSEQNFLRLGQDDPDPDQREEIVADTFRFLHSLKGNSGMFGFHDIESLTHTMETVMGSVKDGTAPFSKELEKMMLQCVDAMRDALNSFSETGEAEIQRKDLLIEALGFFIEDDAAEKAGEKITTAVAGGETAASEETVGKNSPSAVPTGKDTPVQTPAGDKTPEKAVRKQTAGKPSSNKNKISAQPRDIRVSLGKLDVLVNLVSELVIAQSRLTQTVSKREDQELMGIAEEIERLSDALRDSTLGIRMLPIGSSFGKFRRVVWDLSSQKHKEIELVTEGADTELDKTVIEQLSDPLVHLLRNSIDHGIEEPTEREKQGKPRKGTITFSAEHSGGNVLITISDDGRGMDAEKIRRKAEEKGVIPAGAELGEKEILNLIFEPGFSTAGEVTDISGRGVGMDVVRQNITSLRGSVAVRTTEGQGSTIMITLPLTLAIIEGLQVRVGDEFYILPLADVGECVELSGEDEANAYGGQFINLRSELVPYVRLREWFFLPGDNPPIEQVVIVHTAGQEVGLVVDEVIGQQQTVIKNLGRAYRDVKGISGATIQGDGSMALIMDTAQLVEEVIQQSWNRAQGY